MSIINRFLSEVTDPQFRLARDLMALAIADGEITPEEREAIRQICHIENIDEGQLIDGLQGDYDYLDAENPQTRQEKEAYLRRLICLIGADEYCAPQEVYLFQIIAGKMGLNQLDVVGLFLLTATHTYFRGDVGSKVLSSFLHNHIDPKGRTEHDNRESLRQMYETIAKNTEVQNDDEADRQLLQQNLTKATEALQQNHILEKGFRHIGIDFARLLKEEEQKVYRRYTDDNQ